MVETGTEPALTNRTSPRWMHWINLLGNILVVLGAGSIFLFLIRWQPEAVPGSVFGQLSNRTVYLWAYTFGFIALMALIATVDSSRRLRGKPKNPKPKQAGWLRFIILLFPFILWAVTVWKYSIVLPDWIFSILVFLGVLIPAVWLLRMASGPLWGRYKGRDASIISFSSSVSIPFIMLVQLVLVIFAIVILAILNIGNLPQSLDSINEIEELLKSPMVLIVLTVFVAGIAPAVEELFKTLAVWTLIGLDISDGEGYMAGMISGAAFALVEGMLYAAQSALFPGNDWVYFLLGRMGGTLIHIFNGGLIGWALAKTWRDRKFTRLLVIYLLAFIIHGLWNLAVVLTQLIPGLMGQEINQLLSNLVMAVLALLVGFSFVAFTRIVLKSVKQPQVNSSGETYVV